MYTQTVIKEQTQEQWYNINMDIKLDINNLIFENGDLVLVSGLEKIKQHILTALYTLKGDWLLDYEKGIDLPRGMREHAFLLNDVKNQITGVDGVNRIRKIDLIREGTTIKIYAVISTINGDVEISEVMN